MCSTRLHFDNSSCENCGNEVGLDPARDEFDTATVPLCANRGGPELCNWIADGGEWCASCALDLDHAPTALRHPFQRAKRRVLRQFARLGVNLDASPPLRFELREGTEDAPVLTGHADGLVTLNTAEGLPSELVAVRESLGEPYRTPLGHVRHELGHWYWQSHLDVTFSTGDFRALFGDERADYAAALESHYSGEDDGSWQDAHISFYAAAHPWEDFAESFAHALHLFDTSETAWANGMSRGRPIDEALADFRGAYADWVDLTVVINELNRSMGTPDAYPFAVAPAAVEKIAFVAAALG